MAGWQFDSQVRLGPGRVRITGPSMYDPNQEIILDYLLRWNGLPLVAFEAKAENESAADGMQQAQRYAQRLGLRFALASNSREYILIDLSDGSHETLAAPPSPATILIRLGYTIDADLWSPVFAHPWHIDQIAKKKVRAYQEAAIFQALLCFAQGINRVLLLMATGTGKTFTIFQLVWKLIHGGVLKNNRILFLTDRNNLQDQAFRAFSAFAPEARVTLDKDCISKGLHTVGQIYFANYQNLVEDLNGRRLYEHFEPGFFDLVILDECHRSGFGDWFGMLEYFGSAWQLGLTATPREIEAPGVRPLTATEQRRDTYHYFGDAVFTYSLRQAIDDGYLVPYLLQERVTNVDADGITMADGRTFETRHFEREIRLPERTAWMAQDLYAQLSAEGLQNEKVIVFCVDDTHAAFFAQELRRVAGDDQYAARITRSERNSHQLERNFQEVGYARPRVACTVDLLSTGFDAPDVKVIVFARPLRSAILYKQMKGRGTRLCEEANKRFFTIIDYTGASQLEDAEWDGHPANRQKPASTGAGKSITATGTSSTAGGGSQAGTGAIIGGSGTRIDIPTHTGLSILLDHQASFVCLADGNKIPFEDYREQSKTAILNIAPANDLLTLWEETKTRNEIRDELLSQDIFTDAFRAVLHLEEADEVDILRQVSLDLSTIPMRRDRVSRLWSRHEEPILDLIGRNDESRANFWSAALDHYAAYAIDDLERAQTYNAPHFTRLFGPFHQFITSYGGAQLLRAHLTEVKQYLYSRN